MGSIDMQVIASLINEEFKYGVKKYGLHNSMHEAESVLREEIWEATDCVNEVMRLYSNMWEHGVRENNIERALKYAGDICDTAIEGICELIQVAAMAVKFEQSKDMYTQDDEEDAGEKK